MCNETQYGYPAYFRMRDPYNYRLYYTCRWILSSVVDNLCVSSVVGCREALFHFALIFDRYRCDGETGHISACFKGCTRLKKPYFPSGEIHQMRSRNPTPDVWKMPFLALYHHVNLPYKHWALRNKLRWNFHRISNISIHENAFEIVVYERAIICLGLNVPRANNEKAKMR